MIHFEDHPVRCPQWTPFGFRRIRIAVEERHFILAIGEIIYRAQAHAIRIHHDFRIRYGWTVPIIIGEDGIVIRRLVLDGQHRVIAAALYNEWAAENGKETIDVPAIEVELQGNETIAEYINEINITKKEWTTPDYVRGAANINPDSEFLQRYNELIKSEKNPDGYPISTLNLIFCGNNNAISKSDFSLLCSGKDEKGKKVKKPIIPAYNMEIGNKFIQICKDKGFDDKDIAKRHLIQQFNNIKTTAGDANEAIKIFQTITQNDKAAMFNTHGNLDESLVMEQFKKIRERNGNPIIIPVEGTGTASTDADEDIPYLEAEEVR